MITQYGMNEKLGPETYEDNSSSFYGTRSYSEKTASMIDEETNSLLKDAYKRCETLLNQNRNQLDSLANYLLENEKINGKEFKALMEQQEKKSKSVGTAG